MLWTKGAHQSVNFQNFDYSHKNSSNFFISFFLHEAFMSPSCVITHNSSISFLDKTLYSLDSLSIKVRIFRVFEFLGERSPNSSCHFWNHSSFFLQILHYCLVSWHITPPYFLAAQFCILLTKGAHQKKMFQTFDCPHENSPNTSCYSSNRKLVFL